MLSLFSLYGRSILFILLLFLVCFQLLVFLHLHKGVVLWCLLQEKDILIGQIVNKTPNILLIQQFIDDIDVVILDKEN